MKEILEWLPECRQLSVFSDRKPLLLLSSMGTMSAEIGDFIVKYDTHEFRSYSPYNFERKFTPTFWEIVKKMVKIVLKREMRNEGLKDE